MKNWLRLLLMVCGFVLFFAGCSAIKKTYRVGKGTVNGTLWAVTGVYKFTKGTTKLVYKVGEFSFNVAKAPLSWELTNPEIEEIDGLPVKEAIRQGRVKNSPYTVKGKRYHPMTVASAQNYEQEGVASWYGQETLRQKDGHMTANGEAFNPNGLSAAHKLLPLPTNVMVTNLDNGSSVIVRVNDRGPFPSIHNARSGDRIIDLSAAAAKKLGFYKNGTARVRVQAIDLVETG
jgi:rare lipoprotein A